jgi:hypothetical protein
VSLAAAWLLFPALLVGLSVGCGLLVERVSGIRVPGALLPATGLAAIVVCGQFLTLTDATAELTAPAAALLGVVGLGLAGREALARVDPWAAGAAGACFAAFAAPIVLSGEATFAGYIKLDDTATWLALTDRLMEAGRSLDGLPPSTYEATLAFNLGDGYPIGAFLPLGVGSALSGQDVAWTIQPYMAVLGAMLALALWQIARSVIQSRALCALVAFAGSQSALLYGYYLWGGVKEVAAAMLLAAAVPLAMLAVSRRGEHRALVPIALVCAAVTGVLSAGGALWLAVPLALALALLAGAAGARLAARAAAGLVALVVVLSLPVLLPGGPLPPTSSPLTSSDAEGNLLGPLDPAQAAGVWPVGDFRIDPAELAPVYMLIAVVIAAAFGALVHAWRRREWPLLLYVAGTLGACLVIWALGSPWVDGKALATASPAIPFGAAVAGALLWARGMRVEGALVLIAVIGGVLWSNALQYRDVNLAPRDQLAELEEVGEEFAGEGPTLLTEYQPYGARHFLRDADPEAASELRRRRVRLVDGGTLPKGEFADTDRFRLDDLLVYRTLVLRRGPDQSRPPSVYELAWHGDYYEVWQRPDPPLRRVASHLGLGGGTNPVAEPSCARVRELAETAGGGVVRAARRDPTVVATLDRADYPASWSELGTPAEPVPTDPGEVAASIEIRRAGEYDVWLRGSVRPGVELLVDGTHVGEVRHQLNNAGLSVELGEATLAPGRHEITVRFEGADVHPGSGGAPRSIGPLGLTPGDPADARVVEVAPARATAELCGRRWDWIEAVPAI